MNKSIVIVDTNVLFKALVAKNDYVRNQLFSVNYHFIAPNFLMVELYKHKQRIAQASNNSSEEKLLELLHLLITSISFINENLISNKSFIKAFELCKQIDEKDTPFVALSLETSAPIWTYDTVLKNQLIQNSFTNFFEP